MNVCMYISRVDKIYTVAYFECNGSRNIRFVHALPHTILQCFEYGNVVIGKLDVVGEKRLILNFVQAKTKNTIVHTTLMR